MTTNNHPANGLVSLDRLHQIREILSKAAAQSDGGNLGYAMADAVKVIDGAISAFGVEPVGEVSEQRDGLVMDGTVDLGGNSTHRIIKGASKMKRLPIGTKFYITPQAPEPMKDHQIRELVNELRDIAIEYHGTQQLRERIARTVRAAMQPFGNSEQIIKQPSSNDIIGWLRSDYNSDDKRDPNPPLFMLGGNDPSEVRGVKYIPLTGNSPVTPVCWCSTCRPVTMSDMRFVVCPECGNKRCPHANDHRNTCTGSNEPGQEGSAYPAAPQQEVKSE